MQYVEAHGARIPAVGFGTMTLKDAVCVEMVDAALRLGYRHLDTAERYGNEAAVGEGLRTSGLKREEVFLTTKVYWDRSAPGDFEKSVDESLEKLKLPWVDLLLIHWPSPKVALKDSIGSLCKAKRAGLAKHVGVANFTVAMIEEAVKIADEPLVTNQIEVHPYIDQTKVLAACRRHGLSVTAYCPLARGKVPNDETLIRIGKAHGKSASQVALRYLVQQGLIVIPRTSKRERLKENLEIFDFALSETEMVEIGKLKRPDGRVVNPPHAPQWDS
ncbi:MAG TPA: aldo/keto reductase [Xanthobacteraceae bacterium]|jgi:diketogulonate reductase-like aldo/keto reductase|nr:aldo/keto reductase [Xanthobacteraceae bacterium]